jgi:hypothetical protein
MAIVSGVVDAATNAYGVASGGAAAAVGWRIAHVVGTCEQNATTRGICVDGAATWGAPNDVAACDGASWRSDVVVSPSGQRATVAGSIGAVTDGVVGVVAAAGVVSRSSVSTIHGGRRVVAGGVVVVAGGGVAAVARSGGATCGVFAVVGACFWPGAIAPSSGHRDVVGRAIGGVVVLAIGATGARSRTAFANGDTSCGNFGGVAATRGAIVVGWHQAVVVVTKPGGLRVVALGVAPFVPTTSRAFVARLHQAIVVVTNVGGLRHVVAGGGAIAALDDVAASTSVACVNTGWRYLC